MKVFKTKISKAIRDFQKEEDILITYDSMLKIPLNVTIQIDEQNPGSIQTTKIRQTEEGMSFRVEMDVGKKWNIHHHDCEEVILIFKGKLKGLISKKIGTMNIPIMFKPYYSHEVIAEENSIFYVEFKNPKLK